LILLAAQHAQQASGGLSGWEQLGIVVAGTLIAAAILGALGWIRKPAHRIHVSGTSLRAQFRDFDDDDRDAPSHELRVGLVVTNTADSSLNVMLGKLIVEMDDDFRDDLDDPPVRHQLAPGQQHTFISNAPFDPNSFLFDQPEGPKNVSVFFAIDYGRPTMWWLRRRITATIEAKFPYNFFMPVSDPRGVLNVMYAKGGTPRDRLVWPWST
jgi:hypothetical protein